jgi:hypothetical protein
MIIAERSAMQPKSRHIDIRRHFLRELIVNNIMKCIGIPTEDMHADFMTKGLAKKLFQFHRNSVMNVDEKE